MLTRRAPRVDGGWRPDADAVIWQFEDAWRIQVQGRDVRPWGPGDVVEIDGWALRAVLVPRAGIDVPRTRSDFPRPVTLAAAVDTVRVQVGSMEPMVVGGLPGRMLAELAAIEGPVRWDVVAREMWKGPRDEVALRRKWDVTLSRLRERLDDLGVRRDLIHADGSGQVELLLHAGDQVRVVDG